MKIGECWIVESVPQLFASNGLEFYLESSLYYYRGRCQGDIRVREHTFMTNFEQSETEEQKTVFRKLYLIVAFFASPSACSKLYHIYWRRVK